MDAIIPTVVASKFSHMSTQTFDKQPQKLEVEAFERMVDEVHGYGDRGPRLNLADFAGFLGVANRHSAEPLHTMVDGKPLVDMRHVSNDPDTEMRILSHPVDGQTPADAGDKPVDGFAQIAMRGIDQVQKGTYRHLVEVYHSANKISQGAMSMKDLMEFHLRLTASHLRILVASKVAEKASQGVRTLFRAQG